MCETCRRAKASVEGLETRLLEAEQKLRGNDSNPLLRETRNGLKTQLARAAEAVLRLKNAIHGTPLPPPLPFRGRREKEEGQGVLEL